jgi:hypothetical protein
MSSVSLERGKEESERNWLEIRLRERLRDVRSGAANLRDRADFIGSTNSNVSHGSTHTYIGYAFTKYNSVKQPARCLNDSLESIH